MMHIHHTAMVLRLFSSALVLFFVLKCFVYVRNWLRMRGASPNSIPPWRLASFLVGMFLAWVAVASPLVAYDHDVLTVHMIQHLLLMTFAPGLILLGEPLLASWHALPRFAKVVLGPVFRLSLVKRFAYKLSRPALCLSVSALTLIAWHVPALFTLGMHSEVWHYVELASFSAAGFLFWWPVVEPWPSASSWPQWSTVLYLFLATLPCDILSGFLVFSDRVVYPVFFSMPRHFGFSVLEDQQCAAALMWACVTIVYLVPAAILSTRLLSPRSFHHGDLVQSETRASAGPNRNPRRLEAV